MSMGLLAETAAALGEPEHAPALYELVLPYADRVAISYPEISTGSVARYLGLLAALMERWDDAERHFEDALECNERIGARSWLAHTRRTYAAMRLARGAAGDDEAARELLGDAVAAYEELGMRSYADSAARELERAA